MTIIYSGIAPCSEPGRHGGTRNSRALPLLVARATTKPSEMEGNEGEYAWRSVYPCRTTVRPRATAAPAFVVNGLKREKLVAANSMILHELFFASLGAESEPEGELRDALARDFGSVDRWQAEFSAMGKAQGGGSG